MCDPSLCGNSRPAQISAALSCNDPDLFYVAAVEQSVIYGLVIAEEFAQSGDMSCTGGDSAGLFEGPYHGCDTVFKGCLPHPAFWPERAGRTDPAEDTNVSDIFRIALCGCMFTVAA